MFDLTPADAAGLEALAAAQLRLALRFAERAEACEDADQACRLARTSERTARAYRQALLLKMKLQRGLPADPVPNAARAAAADPILRRRQALVMAAERLADDEGLDEDDDEAVDFMDAFEDAVDTLAAEDGFAEGDLTDQLARVCAAQDLAFPAWADEWADLWRPIVAGEPTALDSS